jgi:hypothetical protein
LGATTPTVGSKTSAASIPVVIASDQAAVTVTNSTATSLKASVIGTVSHNAAAPVASSQLGVVPVIYNASSPTLTEGYQGLMSANLAGAIRTTQGPGDAASATVTQVTSSTGSVTLKAANAARIGLSIYNDSTQVLYVKFGSGASSTTYTVKMVAGSYYEAPYGYTGIAAGIWASANGFAYVTETY